MSQTTTVDLLHGRPEMRYKKASVEVDTFHLEHVASTDGNSGDHMDFDRVDGELAKYATATGVDISPEENKRLKAMIDKRVLVVMVITYFIQALDKGTLSFASIMGIKTDLNLVGQQVSDCLN